jgi:hypothetical protein
MQIGIANVGEVDLVWPQIADGMQKACDRGSGEFCAGDFWTMCRSGQAFLIIAFDGPVVHMASVWRFERFGDIRTFHCLNLWGQNLREWLGPAREFVTNIARQNGASRLTACGRHGWLRAYQMRKNGDLYEVDI